MTARRPIHVLHVVHRLERGGIEAWLVEALRRLDRERVASDVLVHTDEPGELDDAVRQAGAKVLPCLSPHRPWRYARNFQRILREHGPYDIVHCHLHSWCGVVGPLAKRAGVKHRLAHSHTDLRPAIRRQHTLACAYHALMRASIRRYATAGLAVSDHAKASLFRGQRKGRALPVRILPAAIDLDAGARTGGAELRDALGLPGDALVVGHVGRFSPPKNHAFLIDAFAALAEREPRARLLLVGEGLLEGVVREQVAARGVEERVVFAGSRDDVPALLAQVMDVVVLPSLYEGLPRVALEAQASGRPIVLATTISREVEAIGELTHWLALDDRPDAWAGRIAELLRGPPPLSAADARDRMRGGPFDIDTSVASLEAIYLECG